MYLSMYLSLSGKRGSRAKLGGMSSQFLPLLHLWWRCYKMYYGQELGLSEGKGKHNQIPTEATPPNVKDRNIQTQVSQKRNCQN